MKKRGIGLWIVGLLISFCLPLAVGVARAEAPTDDNIEGVKPMMRENFRAVVELQKYISTPQAFEKPSNYDTIRRLIDQLAGSAHVIPQAIAEERPGLSAIAVIFSDYMESVRRHLKTGNPEYLRNRLRTATGFCFECHTGLSTERNFKDVEKKIESSSMPDWQKAEFYASTRQFDKALEAYGQLLKSKPEDASYGDALRRVMGITVRVKRDPELTEKFLSQTLEANAPTEALKEQMRQWKKDIADWKQEKPLSDEASSAAWFRQAETLMRRAKLLQNFPADHVAEVTYLRAVNALQEGLSRRPTLPKKVEAYYLLGNAYAALEDPLLFSLDEFYYEACIRQAPHTEIAKKCLQRYSQESYFNYSGSAGVDIPAEEKEKLKSLQSLAK